MRLIGGIRCRTSSRRGQALVEFALVFPVFVLLLFSIIVFGLFVFYNEQLANATREAARYASVHSSTAQCPTVSRLDPPSQIKPKSYSRCDAPDNGWPLMTAAGRSKIWGMAPNQVSFWACWSGFIDPNGNYDALPVDPSTSLANTFTPCFMRDANNQPVSPQTDPGNLSCPTTTVAGNPPSGDDKASDTAADVSNNAAYPTTVTLYGCFNWTPPLAGVILMPSQITLRSVATEVLQRQQ
jgi:TadE-like protein